MIKRILTHTSTIFLIIASISSATADESVIPAPFRGNTPDSKLTINYDDVDTLLKASVLKMGKSQRTTASASSASIGTRMKTNINKLTALEGNRFYYEGFKNDEQKNLLRDIRVSLENLPNEVSLKDFSNEEQLAYWLNLYNVTILDEIIKVYPESKLEDFLTDSDSVLNNKILNVTGIALSLNDIQYTILFEKYNKDPLILYGLYKGIIGSPSIRKNAFTGDNVYAELQENANDFINSNRGTYSDNKKEFRISSMYKRNEQYFPDFNTDIKTHLLTQLEGYTRHQLENSSKIKANISDWKITDLFGTERNFGGSAATNGAALIDSASSLVIPGAPPEMSGIGSVDLSLASSYMLERSLSYGRFNVEQVAKLKELNQVRALATGAVTVTDLQSEEKK